MSDLQNWMQQKVALEMQLEACEQQLQQSAAPWLSGMGQTKARYEALWNEIKEFVVGVVAQKQILKPIFARFPKQITIQDGWISISGAVARTMAFDSNNCFTVFSEAKKKLYDTCRSLYANWESFQVFSKAEPYLKALAGWYNTFLAIHSSIPQLREKAVADMERAMAQEQAPLLAQQKSLQAQLESLTAQIAAAERQAREKLEQDPNYCYCQGENAYFGKADITTSFEEAMQWYQKAADLGHEQAQYSLGFGYYQGQGVEQDFRQAVRWFGKAADQGHDEACYWLGQCYYNGTGVKKNGEKAVQYWLSLAVEGHPVAQYSLGAHFAMTKRKAEAIQWWQKAAEQGYAPAKQMLVNAGK